MITRMHITVHHYISRLQCTEGWGEGTQMNESNNPRQARMDRGKSRIIFCPLRDDLPCYSVRQHHPSNIRKPWVLWLHWLRQEQ